MYSRVGVELVSLLLWRFCLFQRQRQGFGAVEYMFEVLNKISEHATHYTPPLLITVRNRSIYCYFGPLYPLTFFSCFKHYEALRS